MELNYEIEECNYSIEKDMPHIQDIITLISEYVSNDIIEGDIDNVDSKIKLKDLNKLKELKMINSKIRKVACDIFYLAKKVEFSEERNIKYGNGTAQQYLPEYLHRPNQHLRE